jgi:hypothetical protein
LPGKLIVSYTDQQVMKVTLRLHPTYDLFRIKVGVPIPGLLRFAVVAQPD